MRYEELFAKKVATAQDVETYRSQEAQAAATLAATQANLETAKLNLGWTKVTAPVAGRLGQTLVSRGNLVRADQSQLTTIVSLDPMYVFFDADEATFEGIQQLIREGKLESKLPQEIRGLTSPDANAAEKGGGPGTGPRVIATGLLTHHAKELRPVYLGLANEAGFPHVAYIDWINNQITLATATLQVRAVFWNHMPKVGPRVFSPGMFVRVRVPTSPTFQALLVSQEAIQSNLNLKVCRRTQRSGRNRAPRRDDRRPSRQSASHHERAKAEGTRGRQRAAAREAGGQSHAETDPDARPG